MVALCTGHEKSGCELDSDGHRFCDRRRLRLHGLLTITGSSAAGIVPDLLRIVAVAVDARGATTGAVESAAVASVQDGGRAASSGAAFAAARDGSSFTMADGQERHHGCDGKDTIHSWANGFSFPATLYSFL